MNRSRLATALLWPLGLALAVVLPAGTAEGQTVWTKYAGNPVLEVGAPGEWDAGVVDHSEVIFDGGASPDGRGHGLPRDCRTAGGHPPHDPRIPGDMMRETDTHTQLELVITAIRRGIIASPRGEACVTCPILVLADALTATGRQVVMRMES